MKLITAVKGLGAKVAKGARRRSGPPTREGVHDEAGQEGIFWLDGQPRAGQPSDFESWPPEAQDNPTAKSSPTKPGKSPSKRAKHA